MSGRQRLDDNVLDDVLEHVPDDDRFESNRTSHCNGLGEPQTLIFLRKPFLANLLSQPS
jgi:hypothetical protein